MNGIILIYRYDKITAVKTVHISPSVTVWESIVGGNIK